MPLSARVRIALTLGAIIIVIALILARGDRAPSPQNIVAWSGSGMLLSTDTDAAPYDTTSADTSVQGTALDYSRLASLGTAPSSAQQEADFASILAQLSSTPRPFASETSSSAAADAIREAFAMVPQFTVGASVSNDARVRTPAEEAAFAYGNAAGSIIKAYEASHTNAVQIIAAQSSDRTNASKAQALRDLGKAISQVGLDFKKIGNVPSEAAEAHAQFADRYRTSGQLLAAMADAQGDQAYIAAINAYNASVDKLIEAHIALVTYFSLAGVHFSSSDGGSVFSFEGFGGL